ncbi:NUDIX hydrolase [Aquipluma nitroreducens]|nr:hypothetical protein [Aquipluma nitroreducens]
MSNTTIQTLTFIFDNTTDHILLHQIAEDGPLKRKHSGIKGNIGLLEDMRDAAIRSIQETSGLEVSEAVLRGVVKAIQATTGSSTVYMVYESAKFPENWRTSFRDASNGSIFWIFSIYKWRALFRKLCPTFSTVKVSLMEQFIWVVRMRSLVPTSGFVIQSDRRIRGISTFKFLHLHQ